MNHLKSFFLLTVAGSSLIAGTAAAQEQGGSNYYSRDKYEAVRDRHQPAFDPEPIRLGAFLVNATGVVGATANSNVYAQENNEKSDVIGRVGAEVSGATNWSVHEVGFDLSAFHNEYLDLSDESANEFYANLRGRLDVTRNVAVGGRVFLDKGVEQRYSPAGVGGLEKPIEYTFTGVEGYANYQSDRFRWSNSVGITEWDYKDGRLIGSGLPYDQDFRDGQTTHGRTRLSYAISPDLAVYTQATAHDDTYDTQQVIGGALRSRDSSGYTVAAGVDFELMTLIRGDIAVGYLSEDKKDNYFKDVDGLSVDGRMEWFPTRLTTVTLSGGRRVVDTGIYESPSAVSSNIGVRVDHELRRNLILSAEASFSNDDYQEINRSDDLTSFGVSARYKMNKKVQFDAFARHLNRDSSQSVGLSGGGYDINLVGVEIRLHP